MHTRIFFPLPFLLISLAYKSIELNGSAIEKPPLEQPRRSNDESESFRSPFTRKGNTKSYGELCVPDTDISFVSSGRPSVDRMFPAFYDVLEVGRPTNRLSNVSDMDSGLSYESLQYGRKSVDFGSPTELSMSYESDRLSTASQSMDDVEAEMRRLKLELKQTMEMYSTACKEALTAKQKVPV